MDSWPLFTRANWKITTTLTRCINIQYWHAHRRSSLRLAINTDVVNHVIKTATLARGWSPWTCYKRLLFHNSHIFYNKTPQQKSHKADFVVAFVVTVLLISQFCQDSENHPHIFNYTKYCRYFISSLLVSTQELDKYLAHSRTPLRCKRCVCVHAVCVHTLSGDRWTQLENCYNNRNNHITLHINGPQSFSDCGPHLKSMISLCGFWLLLVLLLHAAYILDLLRGAPCDLSLILFYAGFHVTFRAPKLFLRLRTTEALGNQVSQQMKLRRRKTCNLQNITFPLHLLWANDT